MTPEDEARAPTDKEIQRVREWECSMQDHGWSVIQEMGIGPVQVICSHCGKDSGLALPKTAGSALRDWGISIAAAIRDYEKRNGRISL